MKSIWKVVKDLKSKINLCSKFLQKLQSNTHCKKGFGTYGLFKINMGV